MMSLIKHRWGNIKENNDGKFDFFMPWSAKWWHCRNGKQLTRGASYHRICYNDAYSKERKFFVGRAFANTGLRRWMPRRLPDCPIYRLIIYLWLRSCFGTTSTSGWSTAEVCPSRITCLYFLSLLQSDLIWTSKRTTYVPHNETWFFLTAHAKRCT